MTTSTSWDRDACAIVLAGGRSRRMGVDKSLLLLEGVPMIQRIVDRLRPAFAQIIVSTNTPDAHAFLGLPMTVDEYADCGPMGGIASALHASGHDANFVVACDIPAVHLQLVDRLYRNLERADASVPVTQGRFEPLFAWYRKTLLVALRDALKRGEYRMQDLLARHRVATLEVPEDTLINLNTPEDIVRQKKSAAYRAPD